MRHLFFSFIFIGKKSLNNSTKCYLDNFRFVISMYFSPYVRKNEPNMENMGVISFH